METLIIQDNIPGVKGVGAKAASALLSHFHTVPEMYAKLGLVGLPPVPAELAQAAPSSPALKAHVEAVMTTERRELALAELMDCFEGSRTKAITALNKLYLCGYDDIMLYRSLVTLREDLDIEAIVLHGASASNKVDRLKVAVPVEVMAATADLPHTPASSAQVQGLVTAMEDVLVDHPPPLVAEAQTGGVENSQSRSTSAAGKLTTAYFRYRGEPGAQPVYSTTPSKKKKKKGEKEVTAPDIEPRSAQEVQDLLLDISPALAAPLQLLREQYRWFPRD